MAEAEVKIHFIKEGYEIYSPEFDNAKYDLIVVKDGQLARVSVKYCSAKTKYGSWQVNMTNTSRRIDGVKTDLFDASVFDLIAVYLGPEDKVVVVPASMATSYILTIKGSMSERPKEVDC